MSDDASQLQDSISSLEKITKSLEKTFGNIDDKMADMNTNSEKMEKTFGRNKKVLAGIGDALNDMGDEFKRILGYAGKIAEILGASVMLGSFIDLVKQSFELSNNMTKLSYQIGMGEKGTKRLVDATNELSTSLGASYDAAREIVSAFASGRFEGNINDISKATFSFSGATGMAADRVVDFTLDLQKSAGMTQGAIQSMMAGMAKIQYSVGLSSNGMTAIASGIQQAASNMKAFGKSDGQIKKMAANTVALAAALEKVGLNADWVNNKLDQLTDPERIEENIGLYSQLGISMQDALRGGDISKQFYNGLKDMADKAKAMGPIAGANFARTFGMSYKDLMKASRAQADAVAGAAEKAATPEQAALDTLKKIDETSDGIGKKVEKIFNKITGFFRGLGPIILLAIAGIAAIIKSKLSKSGGPLASIETGIEESMKMGAEKGSQAVAESMNAAAKNSPKGGGTVGALKRAGAEKVNNFKDAGKDLEILIEKQKQSVKITEEELAAQREKMEGLKTIAGGEKNMSQAQRATYEMEKGNLEVMERKVKDQQILSNQISLQKTKIKEGYGLIMGDADAAKVMYDNLIEQNNANDLQIKQYNEKIKANKEIERSLTEQIKQQEKIATSPNSSAKESVDAQNKLKELSEKKLSLDKESVSAQKKITELQAESQSVASKAYKLGEQANESDKKRVIPYKEMLKRKEDQLESEIKILKEQKIQEKAIRAANKEAGGLGEKLKNAFHQASVDAKNFANNLGSSLALAIKHPLATLQKGFGDIKGKIGGLFKKKTGEGGAASVETGEKGNKNLIKGMGGLLKAAPWAIAIGLLFKLLKPVIDQLVGKIMPKIKKVTDKLMQVLMPVVEALWAALEPLINMLLGIVFKTILPIVLKVLAVALPVVLGEILELINGIKLVLLAVKVAVLSIGAIFSKKIAQERDATKAELVATAKNSVTIVKQMADLGTKLNAAADSMKNIDFNTSEMAEAASGESAVTYTVDSMGNLLKSAAPAAASASPASETETVNTSAEKTPETTVSSPSASPVSIIDYDRMALTFANQLGIMINMFSEAGGKAFNVIFRNSSPAAAPAAPASAEY